MLASIVEKETSLPTERAHIAGVFVNRLRRGMLLQSDPTIIYVVANGQGPLGREISSADLQVKNPYNTYLFKGLPPGPICNPGLASIQAVLHPMATKDLYFVANGSGGHAFAETLAAAQPERRRLSQAPGPAGGGSGPGRRRRPAGPGGDAPGGGERSDGSRSPRV